MISEILRELVAQKGMTQKDIAKELNISQQRFNFYVNGSREPDIATMILLADYFGVTVDYLIGHEKEPTVKDDGLTESERIFTSLSPERRQEILRYMEFLAAQEAEQ